MRRVVVAAAIVRGGRVLACRRTAPPAAAGRWELPGGKAEPGEPLGEALEREIAEELGCEVEVTTWLHGSAPIGETHELRAAFARITRGEPMPTEHDQVRWLGPEELDDVDWLEPDRPFLPQVRAELAAAGERRRAILFEEEHARLVLRALREDGFDAELVRERLRGEDDEEDHPWAVLTDAPSYALEVLVDEFDGWLDEDTPEQPAPPAGSAPLDLPTAPRRIKNPQQSPPSTPDKRTDV